MIQKNMHIPLFLFQSYDLKGISPDKPNSIDVLKNQTNVAQASFWITSYPITFTLDVPGN